MINSTDTLIRPQIHHNVCIEIQQLVETYFIKQIPYTTATDYICFDLKLSSLS